MTYEETITDLLSRGFGRVERDDRLFDVYPKETREKGVELWEKWEEESVEIVRLKVLPFKEKMTKIFVLDRKKLEKALMDGELREEL